MKKKKFDKKAFIVVSIAVVVHILGIIIVLALEAYLPDKRNKKDMYSENELSEEKIDEARKNYGEWVDSIGLFDNEKSICTTFEQEDNSNNKKIICVNVREKSTNSVSNVLCDYVEKDCSFCKNNSTYFPEGTKKIITSKYKNHIKNGLEYKNFLDNSYQNWDIDYTKDGSLRVCKVDKLPNQSDFSANTEVIECFLQDNVSLGLNNIKRFEEDVVKGLKNAKSLKHFILVKPNDLYKVDDYISLLKRNYPNIKVYEKVQLADEDKANEIKKIVGDPLKNDSIDIKSYIDNNNDEDYMAKPLDKKTCEKIKKEHGKWIDFLGVFENTDTECIGFNSGDDSINEGEVLLEDKDVLSINLTNYNNPYFKYNQLKQYIDKDTEFVKNNKDYFKNGTKRAIFTDNLDYYDSLSYKNFLDKDCKDLDIKFDDDGTLKVLYMDFNNSLDSCLNKSSYDIESKYNRTMKKDSEELLMGNIYTDDVEVLEYEVYDYLVDEKTSSNSTKKDNIEIFKKYILQSLKNAKSLKHIVLIESNEEVNSDKYVDLIHNEYPDIEVHKAKRQFD